MNEARRVGITPYLVRLASYFAQRGHGTYTNDTWSQVAPESFRDGEVPPPYAKIVVKESLPWMSQDNVMHSQLVQRVEFWDETRCVRWVEFSLMVSGFGGDDVFSVIRAPRGRSQSPGEPPLPRVAMEGELPAGSGPPPVTEEELHAGPEPEPLPEMP